MYFTAVGTTFASGRASIILQFSNIELPKKSLAKHVLRTVQSAYMERLQCWDDSLVDLQYCCDVHDLQGKISFL